MKNYLFCMIFFSGFILGCDKNKNFTRDKVFKSKMTLEEILKINEVVSNASFTIQEYSTIGNGNFLPHSIEISGSLKRTASPNQRVSLRYNGEEIVLHSGRKEWSTALTNINPQTNIFGKKIVFSNAINANGRLNSDEWDSLYIPEQIRLDFPEYVLFGASRDSILSASTVSEGQQIQWNTDTSNSLGVLLFVEYFFTDDGNGLQNPETDHTSNAILVDDTGSFTLTAELFEDIPDGAAIRFSIVRANYYIINDDNGDVADLKVYAYSTQEAPFKYVRNQ